MEMEKKMMRSKILKILKESGDFDWAGEIPSFLEVLQPVSNRNPKDVWRLHFNLGYGENFSRWSSDWVQFKNNGREVKDLQWLISLIEFSEHNEGFINPHTLASKFLNGQEWIMGPYLSDWKAKDYDKLSETERQDTAEEWIVDILRDYGLWDFDDYSGKPAPVEDWKVTYFDKNGVEHFVRVNNI
jgi:hypothetical protein